MCNRRSRRAGGTRSRMSRHCSWCGRRSRRRQEHGTGRILVFKLVAGRQTFIVKGSDSGTHCGSTSLVAACANGVEIVQNDLRIGHVVDVHNGITANIFVKARPANGDLRSIVVVRTDKQSGGCHSIGIVGRSLVADKVAAFKEGCPARNKHRTALSDIVVEATAQKEGVARRDDGRALDARAWKHCLAKAAGDGDAPACPNQW